MRWHSGVLLADGIGDTIRVSLTGDPVEEVRVAAEILRTLELAAPGAAGHLLPHVRPHPRSISSRWPWKWSGGWRSLGLDLEVAVMGCVVNGPGEARKADFGIAGGDGEGVVFAEGRPVRKVPQEQLVDALFRGDTRRPGAVPARARSRRQRGWAA